MRFALIAAVAAVLGTAGLARAEVKSTWAAGIRLENKVVIAAPPETVYAALGQIGKWWDSEHTYTGDAANMTIALEPGACFCERFPKGGGVKHGEVVLAWPSQMLRINGDFGPLQDEGASGALTFTLKAARAAPRSSRPTTPAACARRWSPAPPCSTRCLAGSSSG